MLGLFMLFFSVLYSAHSGEMFKIYSANPKECVPRYNYLY